MSITLTVDGSPPPTLPQTTFSAVRLKVDTRLGATFEFAQTGKFYEPAFQIGNPVEVRDPNAGNVLRFTGHIEDIRKSSGEIIYVASDYRGKARKFYVQRRGSDEAVPDKFPRRVYNAPPDDPDRVASSGNDLTVGEILQDLFDSHRTDLQAAGIIQGTGYVQSELDLLTFKPPKVVFDQVMFDEASLRTVQRQGPSWAVYPDLGGVWHFYDRLTPPLTGVLEFGTDPLEPPQFQEDVRNAFTAVSVYGRPGDGERSVPRVVGFGTDEGGNTLSGLDKGWNPAEEATWTKDSDLSDRGIISSAATDTFTIAGSTWTANIWAGGDVIFPRYSPRTRFSILSSTSNTITLTSSLPPSGAGANDPVLIEKRSDVFRLFQVTNPARRGIIQQRFGDDDCCPRVEAILRGSFVGKQSIAVQVLDDGFIRTEVPLFRSPTNGRIAGDSTLYPDFKFMYCSVKDDSQTDLVARWPVSGFSGPAVSKGVQRELRVIVDGYDDPNRDQGNFEALAQEIHRLVSRVRLVGRVATPAIDYRFADPRRGLSFSHPTDTIGYESANTPISSIQYTFVGEEQTAWSFGDDGSSTTLNYQQILEEIQQRGASDNSAAEGESVSDYVRCRTAGINYPSAGQVDPIAGDGGTGTIFSFREPIYVWPRTGAGIMEARARCDENTLSCDMTEEEGIEACLAIYRPNQQHSLQLKHPRSDQGLYCRRSQLLVYESYYDPTNGNPQHVGYRGSYYPILCKFVTVGDEPDTPGATGNDFCVAGFRDLVVLEPTLDPDDHVGIGAFILDMLRGRDLYMQRNEEAHAGLDNRIAQLQNNIWGGVPNPLGAGDRCAQTVVEPFFEIWGELQRIIDCINMIKQGECPPLVCDPPRPPPDFECCTPCGGI